MHKLKGYVLAGISAATFGLIPLFSIPVMRNGISIDSILTHRFLIAIIAIGIMMKFQKESFRLHRDEILPLFFLGLLYAGSAFFLFQGYKMMPTGVASTILFLYPVIVTIISAVFFREPVSLFTLVCIAIAFTGVSMLYVGDNTGTISFGGVLVVILSSVAYSFYMVLIKKSKVARLSGPKLTFYVLIVSFFFFGIKSLFAHSHMPLSSFENWFNVFLLSIVTTVVSCITLVYAIEYVGATATAILGALEPLTAVVVGLLVFHEPFSLSLIFGFILIAVAVTILILSDNIQEFLRNGYRRLRFNHLMRKRRKTL